MNQLSVLLAASVIGIVSTSAMAQSQEAKILRSRIAEQTKVSLTVYSNGRALVRDRRKVSFDRGRFQLEIQDVSSKMKAETAQFKSLSTGGELTVLEQNLEFDLISPQQLLEKFLGRTVSVIRVHPTNGSETAEPAEVLAVQNGVVLRMKDRIETGIPGRISFPDLPASLRAEPTLSLLIDSKKRGEQDVELSYQTEGISWRADYNAELNEDETQMNLNGLVTLTNQSGTSFRNAQLQLMGGDIQTVERESYRATSKARMYASPMVASLSADSSAVSGDAFFEYHLYTLPRATSIMSNQTKQVTLLQAGKVQTRKELIFTSGDQNYYSPEDEFNLGEADSGSSADDAELGAVVAGGVFLAFENDKDAKIGMPLPAGILRVYKSDKNGMSQFIGEDNIRHTPEGERVRVRLGRSFDVTTRRKRTSFKNLPASGGTKKFVRNSETGVRVTFKNAKSVAQQVIYREVIPGDWKIVSSNHDHKKISKDNAEWQLSVPAKGKVVLDFRVQVGLRN